MNKSKRFEDFLTETIYDNVHGFILLTKEEKSLLSTVYFQRLNHIRQLGLSYFVFPGAVHTRFSHSLGVLHIVEKLIQRLKQVNCDYFHEKKFHQIVRLSALLHDIGHYPLSHTIEKSYMENLKYQNSIKNAQKIKIRPSKAYGEEDDSSFKEKLEDKFKLGEYCESNNIQTFLEYYDHKPGDGTKSEMHHESLAKTVITSSHFAEILKNSFELNDEDLDDICNIIAGTNRKYKYFLASKLIHSNFDADQMDYMLRDTFNTGINASIDLDFIIGNLDVCDKLFEEDRQIRKALSFNIRAIQSIEQFILAKYYWYSNILYYDKSYLVNNIAQRMFTSLLVQGKLRESSFKDLDGIKTILKEEPEQFFYFNDNYFWEEIKHILKNKDDNYGTLIPKLAEMLVKRKFPEVKKSEFFDSYFGKDEHSKIKYFNQILIDDDKLKKDKKRFKEQIECLNSKNKNYNYLGFAIDRDIIKIDRKKEVYFENNDINIHLKNCECENILNFPDQFFSQFIEIRQRKLEENAQKRLKKVIQGKYKLVKISSKSKLTDLKIYKEIEEDDKTIMAKKLFAFKVYDFSELL